MKIIVAEDDLVTREILKRLLAPVADEIFDAGNGIEALELIDRELPDVLVTDLHMPLLGGMEVVEAVRASRDHAMMPIVCLSSVKDKDEITKLVSLGIADYILKPIRSADVGERLRKIVTQNAGWRLKARQEAQETILVVDADAAFREFVTTLLASEFRVADASSGAHALRLFQQLDPKPTAVLVSEGLPLVAEAQLAGLITRAARDSGAQPPPIWLVSNTPPSPDGQEQPFAGTLVRSTDAAAFMEELRRTVLAKDPTVGGATPNQIAK